MGVRGHVLTSVPRVLAFGGHVLCVYWTCVVCAIVRSVSIEIRNDLRSLSWWSQRYEDFMVGHVLVAWFSLCVYLSSALCIVRSVSVKIRDYLQLNFRTVRVVTFCWEVIVTFCSVSCSRMYT